MQQLVNHASVVTSSRLAWAEIDLQRLAHNIRTIRRRVGKTAIMAVVKADAYGHGVVETAKLMLSNGVDKLAVALTDEAIQLRNAGIEAPILIMGLFSQNETKTIVQYGLTPSVCTWESMLWLEEEAMKAKRNVHVHVRIDLGSGGLGLYVEECTDFMMRSSNCSHVFVEGLFTHLTASYGGNPLDVIADITTFESLRNDLQQKGICPPIVHAASSPGILQYPESYFDMVRPGIILYGLPVYEGCADEELKPIMQLKAKIMYIKEIKEGTRSGYGHRVHSDRDIKLAMIPLGYGDGMFLYYLRRGEVLIRGQKAVIFGQMYMDHFMVDVTHIQDVSIGDETVIIGSQGTESLTSEEVALRAGIGNMNSDCVHLLSPRIPRYYNY